MTTLTVTILATLTVTILATLTTTTVTIRLLVARAVSVGFRAGFCVGFCAGIRVGGLITIGANCLLGLGSHLPLGQRLLRRLLSRCHRLGGNGRRPSTVGGRTVASAGQIQDQVDDLSLAGTRTGLAAQRSGDRRQFVAVLAFQRSAFQLGGVHAHNTCFSRADGPSVFRGPEALRVFQGPEAHRMDANRVRFPSESTVHHRRSGWRVCRGRHLRNLSIPHDWGHEVESMRRKRGFRRTRRPPDDRPTLPNRRERQQHAPGRNPRIRYRARKSAG